ncbi:MAG TPA: lipoyl synthase [Deltaproteobacteria bacterium]|nr:lipoyl synthase [Deltaproteobacteria bacterium]
MSTTTTRLSPKKPPWLKVPFPGGERYSWIKKRAANLNLSTVCEEANCPNIGECWNGGTATFMLMGDTCTRGCRFCSVKSAKNPGALDPEEPKKLAETVKNLALKYVVLTTVDRDDLPDQGASHIARCIRSTQRACPEMLIEMLMPDFQGKTELVQQVINARPAVLAHNLETVRSLTDRVRDSRASYDQSLDVLRYLKQQCPDGYTKSSLMLGVGESRTETMQAMKDLRDVGVDFLTIGQYLQPSKKHLKVEKFMHPDEFDELALQGDKMGFEYVASGPLVRSSYKAAEFYIERKIRVNA